jgi:3',5'-cyclic AMP phosphodiesterase CpdA
MAILQPTQVKKHHLKYPAGQKNLVGLICPDVHCDIKRGTQGGVDPYAWSVFLQSAQIIKPDFMVVIGDFMECTSVNSYQWQKKKRPPLEYTLDELDMEYEAASEYLDQLDKVVGKKCQKIFLEGNHELWIDNLFVENKHTDPRFRPENGMQLAKRGYKYYKHGTWIQIGKVNLNHGTMAKGVNHPRSMLNNHGGNLIYGHTHDLQKAAKATLGGVQTAHSCGFLGLKDKDFLRGATTNWEHGFMTLHTHKTGYFTPKQYSINYGTTWVHGKRIRA